MQKEINTGVMLNVIPTQQFKTTRVVISFLKELTDRKELVMRTLLANILETSSQAYPTQKAVTNNLSGATSFKSHKLQTKNPTPAKVIIIKNTSSIE